MDPSHANSAIDSKEMSISPPSGPSRNNSATNIPRVHGHAHRQSFAENLRGLPPSPRAQPPPVSVDVTAGPEGASASLSGTF